MRKLFFIILVLTTFIACNKTEQPVDNHFKAGQKVRIGVSSQTTTKVSSSLNGSKVDFTWDEGDKIKVTVTKDKKKYPASFKLVDGEAGKSEAMFEGTMPADGETFTVNFPYEDPTMNDQDYVEGTFPKNMIMFEDKNASLNNGAKLNPTNGGLCLKLKGKDITVSEIKLTYKISGTPFAITLNCGEGVTLNENSFTPFYIVIPGLKTDYKIEIKNSDTSISTDEDVEIDLSAGEIICVEKTINQPT